MRVFLVRHADADAEVPDGLGDEGRALTARARQTVVAHFAALKERLEPTLMLTSPLVRTVQTASLLAVVLGYEGLLRAHRALLPDMPVGAIDGLIAEHADQQLILVGHNPSMTAMAAHLLGLQSFPRPVTPGTVIGIEDGRLLFYAAPGQPILEAL